MISRRGSLLTLQSTYRPHGGSVPGTETASSRCVPAAAAAAMRSTRRRRRPPLGAAAETRLAGRATFSGRCVAPSALPCHLPTPRTVQWSILVCCAPQRPQHAPDQAARLRCAELRIGRSLGGINWERTPGAGRAALDERPLAAKECADVIMLRSNAAAEIRRCFGVFFRRNESAHLGGPVLHCTVS